MIGSFYLHRRTSKTKKQSAPRALTHARRQFGVRSDVQARLELGLAAPNIDGLRPAQVKPIINLSKAFSCFAGVAQRHDHLSKRKRILLRLNLKCSGKDLLGKWVTHQRNSFSSKRLTPARSPQRQVARVILNTIGARLGNLKTLAICQR